MFEVDMKYKTFLKQHFFAENSVSHVRLNLVFVTMNQNTTEMFTGAV